MQIEQVPSTLSSPMWLITLETDEERALTDEQIVKIAENCKGVEWDHEAGQYRLNGEDFGPDVGGRFEVDRGGGDVVAVMLRY